MRLRRIEPSKTATATATTSAPAPAASTASASTRSAKASASTHHPAKHSHHNVGHIACSSTLPLRLRYCILHSLSNVVLAITRQPIGLSHRAIHRH
jgi:hypothetical protein